MVMLRPVLLCLLPTMATAEPLCDGRYASATAIVDAAYGQYGTLYSGGGHWHRRDNLGPTLDVWRLLRDESDLNLRRVDDLVYSWSDDPLAQVGAWDERHQMFAGYLPLLEDADATAPSDEDAYLLAVTADVITTLGPGGVWWRGSDGAGLSAAEQQTQALAETFELVDWLQVTLVTSDAPWAYGWHTGASWYLPRTFEDLSSDAIERFDSSGDRAWLVAAAITSVRPSEQLDAIANGLRPAIRDCTASQSDFATYAILRFHQMRNRAEVMAEDAWLPDSLRELAHEYVTMRALTPRPWFDDPVLLPDAIAVLRTDDRAQVWENVARSYMARDLDALIAVHDGLPLHPYVIRLLNSLSAEDIARFALESGRSEEEERAMLSTAMARYFAMGQHDAAEALVQRLMQISPDQAARIGDIQGQVWPQDVRLSLILLALPEGRTWLRPLEQEAFWWEDVALRQRHVMARGMDVPMEMRTGAALQRDLESYLRVPSRWGAMRGMRGYGFAYMDRANARRVRPDDPRWGLRMIAERPDDALVPIASLIAWDELHHFAPETGAARQIAETLVRWVDRRTDTGLERWFAPQDEMAEALRQIVLLARWNNIGAFDGKPLARQAFELMHYRLYDSPATAENSFWHNCAVRCER